MKRTMPNATLPIRKRRVRKTVTWAVPLTAVREIPPRHTPLCYRHTCKYEVLLEPWDFPEDQYGSICFAESNGEKDE